MSLTSEPEAADVPTGLARDSYGLFRVGGDKAAVEAIPGVITVVEAGGQFQIVIGNTSVTLGSTAAGTTRSVTFDVTIDQ